MSSIARLRSVLVGLVLTLWVGTPGRAAIPEPDVVFHGVPRLNGAVLEPGDEVVIAIGSDVLGSYAIGAPQGAGDGRYVLRVPLVRIATGEPRPPGRAVQGARATISCRKTGGGSVPGGDVTIGERGTITSRDVECLGGPSTTSTTTTSLPGTSTTISNTTTTSTTTTVSTVTTSTTTTTLPTCGNGTADSEETCGDPGTVGCVGTERCVACRCESCPAVTLECSEWVGSFGGVTRRATVRIDGSDQVRAIELGWDAAQMRVDHVGAPADDGAESGLPGLACAVDAAQAAATCEQTAPAGEPPGFITTVDVQATPLADGGSRLVVERLVDAAGATFEGCELPAGCCVTGTDCDPSDACHQAPTCGTDNRCRPGPPLACDDGDVCTTDTCEPPTGCRHARIAGCCNATADCDDGDACNGAERCTDGACVAGTPIECDDGDACTEDTCVPASGCEYSDAELPDAKRAGLVCSITNVRTFLPEAEGLAEKAKKPITSALAQIERAVDAAAGAKPKKCRVKLATAQKLTKALLKTVNKLAKKNQLGTSGDDLIALLEDLASRITQAQQGAAVYCAQGS